MRSLFWSPSVGMQKKMPKVGSFSGFTSSTEPAPSTLHTSARSLEPHHVGKCGGLDFTHINLVEKTAAVKVNV